MRTLQLRSEKRFEAMCASKKRYRTLEHAEKILKRRMQRIPGLKLRLYLCPLCVHYHLTSQKP
jgi:hypothetical protein